ncbi:ribose ABC transporter permease [Bacteroidia bacterium]|nr:ribose ABC transporter permease [Bacteroidia bacterium]
MQQGLKKAIRSIPAEMYVLVLLFIGAMILYDSFFTFTNISNILRQSSVLGLVSIGMTVVIIAGSIDLSIGMMLGFSGAIAIKMADNLLMAMVVTLLASVVIGLVNGLLISRLKLPPMITTISMNFLLRGVIFILNGPSAVSVSGKAASFKILGQGYLFGIPVPILIYILVTLLIGIVMKRTIFGRHLYAVGGNADSAAMMGVKNDQVLLSAHVLCSVLVGFAGIILTSRLGAFTPLQGENFETRAITAAVISGTLLSGGVGKVWGTFTGALILGLISNIFNLQGNILNGWQFIINGALMLFVVIIQSAELRRLLEIAARKVKGTDTSRN